MDFIKSKLNVLIEYYRKNRYLETKDKNFSKEYFSTVLVDGKQETICSPTSYRKLVNGESLKNDTIYCLLLEKLGYEYNEEAYVYTDDFKQVCIDIVHSLETDDIDKLEKQLNYCLDKMNSNDIVEIEYQNGLESIKRFYVDSVEKDRYLNFQKILDLFVIYNEEIKQCLTTPLYNYCILSNQTEKIYAYYSNIKQTPFHRTNLLYYQIDNNYKLDEVEEEMNYLLQHYNRLNNKNMMLRLMIMNMKYYYWLGKESDSIVLEIDKFINENRSHLKTRVILNYLYFKAKKYNREKKYKQARDTFDELLHADNSYFSIVLGYYFNCLVQLDETVVFEEALVSQLNGNSKVIYHYFQIPKLNYHEREQYILNEICTEEILSQEYIAKSFLSELRNVVRKSKHYVLLERYLEKTDGFL